MYNPEKDRTLKEWTITVTDTSRAVISLKRYDGGDPKLVLTHLVILKADGSQVHAKMRRWGWDELLKLREVISEAIDLMDRIAAKRK